MVEDEEGFTNNEKPTPFGNIGIDKDGTIEEVADESLCPTNKIDDSSQFFSIEKNRLECLNTDREKDESSRDN